MPTTAHSQGTYLRTLAPSLRHNTSTKSVLIYFITGNPGYIGYYHTFLDSLSSFLTSTSSTPNTNFTLLGRSLQGFEPTPENITHGPFDFPEVIDATYRDVLEQKEKGFDVIILIGHSVGSYIALEVLSRLRGSDRRSSSPNPPPDTKTKLNAILLFPTVTHIAQSPSGVKFRTLFSIPKFPTLVHYLSQFGFWALSDSILKAAVKRITGMPENAAAVTAHFLRSKTGVAQSLHMARDEMKTITEDKWDAEIWGVEGEKKEKSEAPRLVFLFGEDDHWVADHTRDALIKARGNGSDRVKMVLDEDKIPHGFCIHHSGQVAEKVKTWVESMVGEVLDKSEQA